MPGIPCVWAMTVEVSGMAFYGCQTDLCVFEFILMSLPSNNPTVDVKWFSILTGLRKQMIGHVVLLQSIDEADVQLNIDSAKS